MAIPAYIPEVLPLGYWKLRSDSAVTISSSDKFTWRRGLEFIHLDAAMRSWTQRLDGKPLYELWRGNSFEVTRLVLV
jgi:hypothetical protein